MDRASKALLWVSGGVFVVVGMTAWLGEPSRAANQPVGAKSGHVELDGKVPDLLAMPVSPDASQSSTTPNKWKITTKTFVPPDGWKFQPFGIKPQETYVDCEAAPDAMPPDKKPDSAMEIKVTVDNLPMNAGAFALKCEGNLTPPPGGKIKVDFFWRVGIRPSTIRIVRCYDSENASKSP